MTFFTPQAQRAGDHSTQVQVHGDLVLRQGVTEERAAEIALAVSQEVVERYAEEASHTAEARIEELDRRLVPLLASSERLGAFADPAFLVALRSAQIGAASTDREGDYELLADLLNDHAARSDVRPVRAGIRRAIEVVDQLDTDALRALTVHTALVQYHPNSASVDNGLAVMEGLFSSLVAEQSLPGQSDWIDHLEVLDAVRINSATNFVKFREYFSKTVSGYVAIGLPADAAEIPAIIDRLRAENVDVELIPHELKPGFVRFPMSSDSSLRKYMETAIGPVGTDRALDIIATDLKMGETDPAACDALMNRISDEFPHFSAAAAWWDTVTPYFQTTAVGRVLARANASRLYSGDLPPIA